MKPNALLLTLTAVALLGHVAQAEDKEQRQMMADIRMLQEQTQQMQNLIVSLNDTIAAAVKAVNARVDGKAEEQANVTRKAFADQLLTINAITTDLRTMKEKVDDNSVRVGTLTQEIAQLRQIVTHLNATRATADPVFGPADGAPAPPPAVSIGASPQEVWGIAQADYSLGNYDLAVTGFRTFITTFPGDQADDAQVMICKSYINLGKYQEGIRECDTAIRAYPSSDKLAEAYYKKGLAHQNLKQSDRAREAYETVITRFPNTAEAVLAEQGRKGLDEVRKP